MLQKWKKIPAIWGLTRLNYAALAAIGSLLAVIAVVLGAAFTHGQLTQRVSNTEEKVADHAVKLERHDEKFERQDQTLGDHSVKIGRLQEWKEGFSAGARLGKETP